MRKASDADFVRKAISLAERGLGHVRPNPPVGAVVVADGKIIGRGWHRRCGGDHAEVAAMRDAQRRCGEGALAGASLYVTLEPCSRPGRVGACTDAILASGIKRVVYAVPDPNPVNRGKAQKILRAGGVECERLTARALHSVRSKGERDFARSVVREAKRLIAPFAKHVLTGLPFVTVKIAMSLDGRICDKFGAARWISSEAARRETGRLRSLVDAVMVGAETIRRDDPSLLCRFGRNNDLFRVVVSRSGRLPENAKVFTDSYVNPTLVYSDAREALKDLGRRGFTHVLCEGGLTLAVSLAEAGLVDEWISVVAPVVIGEGSVDRAKRPFASLSFFPAGVDAFCRWHR